MQYIFNSFEIHAVHFQFMSPRWTTFT